MATGISFDGQKSVRGSEEDFHIVCLPCYRDGETMAAFGYCCQCKEHLCAGCFRYHKKPRPFKHHRLLDKDEMPDTQDLDATVQPSPSDNLTTPCPHHKNEMLNFYCHDHKMLLCGICVALEHTKQCQVAYIPYISEQIISSKEYENVAERINKILTECASIKDKTSEDSENSNSSMNEGLEDMRRLRQKIIDKFDKMEEDIENKIQALKQQNEDRQEEDESICNDVIKRVTMLSDSMKQLNASKQADLLFMELKQAVNHLQEYEKSIRLLSTKGPIETYKFLPSSMIIDMLQSKESLGDLTATQQQQHASTSEQQPDQTADQTKQNNCQDQTSSTLTQQQQQRTSTSDKQQGQVIDETKAKGIRTQATTSSDEQQQGKIEAQSTPTNLQAQPTNSQVQAATTSSQLQDKTSDQIKPNSNGPYVASSSDQQQDQTKPTRQQAKQMHAPSQNQLGGQIKPKSQQHRAYNKSNQNEALTQSASAQFNPVLRPGYDNIQATRHCEMNVKTSEDKEGCFITGMTTLPSGKLVLADCNNNAIKLFDINTNKIISRLTLGLISEPWDITATSSTHVAVSVPDEKEIQFITATDKLSFSHKVETNGKCYGICYFEDTLVVTYKNPGKLDIMNMQGKVMANVRKYSTGQVIFKDPDYVQANSNYIYVSDNGTGQVMMLNWRGEVTGRIGGLCYPEGLTLSHDGNLLVCDWGWGCGTVYHVSGDCTNKSAVLASVRYPQAICVDDGGHTLYISRVGVSSGENNNILVYKL